MGLKQGFPRYKWAGVREDSSKVQINGYWEELYWKFIRSYYFYDIVKFFLKLENILVLSYFEGFLVEYFDDIVMYFRKRWTWSSRKTFPPT